MRGSVCIVIVNYRTATVAIDCIASIASQIADIPACRVVLVDNASADGSLERLSSVVAERGWHSWVTLVDGKRNGGFAFGNNCGIADALNRDPCVNYLLLLNPDTIVGRNAIGALIDFMDANDRAGIAGSLLANAEGGPECSAHNAPSPLGELESGARLGLLSRLLQRYVVTPPMRDCAHECDWVSGASMIVRRKVFEEIGGLDEGFFLYFEEVDFCSRARRTGWEIWFVPESRVIHFEGSATGIRQRDRRRPAYWYDSRRRYFVKHFGVSGLILADLFWAVGRATLSLRRLVRPRSGGNTLDPQYFARDLLWGDIHALLNGKATGIRRDNVVGPFLRSN